MSLKEYKAEVKKAAVERIGKPVYNASLEHASVIVENMFEYANSNVCILSGELNARVYGREEVVEQAKLFLAHPAHSARILLEDGTVANRNGHPFFEELEDAENIEIRALPKEMQNSYNFHFLVMDDDSYRFESDRSKCAAVAAFGDSDGAKNMRRIFDILWESGEALEPRLEDEVSS
jgi:hypothetical protein